MPDEDCEPFPARTVQQRCRNAVEYGTVVFTRHAKASMEERDLDSVDIQNVLRGGKCEFSEEECGSHRYRIVTPRIIVVVAIRNRTTIVVVTAWRVS